MDQDRATLAIVCWLFAPLSSYFFLKHQDSFVREHAKSSFLFGIFSLFIYLGLFILGVLSIFLSFLPILNLLLFLIECLLSIASLIILAVTTIPRLIGIVKVLNKETWEVPHINNWMGKFIKL